MKVTYKTIPVRVRCPYQNVANVCYPGCGCSGESCWEEVTKEVSEKELKKMINDCKWIIKVEP